MIWILILLVSKSSGFTATTAEFNTQQACQVAADTMKSRHPYLVDSAICVAKGEKK